MPTLCLFKNRGFFGGRGKNGGKHKQGRINQVPLIATRWTEEEETNDTFITLTRRQVHDIRELTQRFRDRSPITIRTVDPILRAMVEDEDWYDQPDYVRQAIHDFYRLIRI